MKSLSLAILAFVGLFSFQSLACTTYEGHRVCSGDVINYNGSRGVVTGAYNGNVDVDWYNGGHGSYNDGYSHRYYYNERDYRTEREVERYYENNRYNNNDRYYNEGRRPDHYDRYDRYYNEGRRPDHYDYDRYNNYYRGNDGRYYYRGR